MCDHEQAAHSPVVLEDGRLAQVRACLRLCACEHAHTRTCARTRVRAHACVCRPIARTGGTVQYVRYVHGFMGLLRRDCVNAQVAGEDGVCGATGYWIYVSIADGTSSTRVETLPVLFLTRLDEGFPNGAVAWRPAEGCATRLQACRCTWPYTRQLQPSRSDFVWPRNLVPQVGGEDGVCGARVKCITSTLPRAIETAGREVRACVRARACAHGRVLVYVVPP